MNSAPAENSQAPLGVIFAGGPGTRIGGDKPFRKVAGKRLIDIAMDRLARVCPRILIAALDLAPFAGLGVELVRDRWPGQGPLAAMATVFLETGATSMVTLPVDTPFVHPDILKLLAATKGQRAVVPSGPGGLEPLVSYYHRDCLPQALGLIRKNERRPRILLNLVKAQILTREEVLALDPEDLSFINVNSAEDLDRANRIWAESWAG
jgi:molybdopterin-guanine dinucleotide biosynthesis protein A